MLVEILSVSLKKGIVEIQALDVSEENLSRMERMRDDMNNPEITFLLDTREGKVLTYLNSWLHRQKAVRKQECTTWGQALQAVVGTITTISGNLWMWREWNAPEGIKSQGQVFIIAIRILPMREEVTRIKIN